MIGNTYGSLTVIGWAPETRIATVRCMCNNIEGVKYHKLVSGYASRCRTCASAKKYLESLKIDMKLLGHLSIERSSRVLGAFAKHIEASHQTNIRATSFSTFVRETLADPDFFKDEEEIDQSFEARLMRSNPQSYKHYQRPRL